MDLQQANALEAEANKHNGTCTHCHQTIKIYRYGISDSMVRVLVQMAKRTKLQLEGGDKAGRSIDVDILDLRHSERTQITKLRFHGLLAKVKNDDNTQIARRWLITRKGWEFLAGSAVPAKVVVYNNQVLGHDGGTTDIRRITGGNGDYEEQAISEAESRAYAHVRKPEYQKTVTAIYNGVSVGALVRGNKYSIKMAKLQMGKPLDVEVQLDEPKQLSYSDIAAFGKSWEVV